MADKKYGLWLHIRFNRDEEELQPVSLVVTKTESKMQWWALWPMISAEIPYQGFWRPEPIVDSMYYPQGSDDASSPKTDSALFALYEFCPGELTRYLVTAKKHQGAFLKSLFPQAASSFFWSVYLSPD
jgi:hypothetical protein